MAAKSVNFLKKRLSRFRACLKTWKVDACFITHPVDLFYLTGLKMSAGKLIVDLKRAVLLVDGRYLAVAQEKAPMPAILWAASTEKKQLKKFKKVAFDSLATSHHAFSKLQEHPVKWLPIPDLLKEVRAIKDPEELNHLRRSALLLWKGFQHLQTLLKPGVREKEVALRFEIFCRERGAEGMAFEPIIAFGANSAMPHHRASETQLKAGDPILIDIGIVLNGYRSDMTRAILPKKASAFLKKIDTIVREAKAAALELCKPGMPLKALDLAVREVMRRQGVEEHFVHSLGHGVGLDIHEYPRIKHDGEDKDVRLAAGMVITIEPGLYFPGQFGIRYEDTVAISKTGYENFYPSDPA